MVFVDREEELSWLISLYRSRYRGSNYNVILYGLRRVGKTALMEEFVSRIDYGILLRLAHITSGTELVRDLISALRDLAMLKKLNIVEHPLPDTAFDALKFLVEYPQLYAEENGIVLAVCLDEFHLLLEHLAARIAIEEKLKLSRALEKVFWYLKDSIPTTRNVFWVLSTSLSWHLLEKYTQLSPARKAFLALFTTRRIEPLTKDSSLKLIQHLSKTLEYNIPNSIAERIYEMTGGIPALIEIIVSHIAPRQVRDMDELNNILEKLSKSTELNDFFEAIIDFIDEVSRHGKTIIMRVMRSIAEGNTTPKIIARSERMDYNVAYNVLEELVEIGFVTKQKLRKENIYLLKYPLMKTWLLASKPYVSTEDRQKIRMSLGIMFDKYVEGLFRQAKKLTAPLIIKERNGMLFNNTTEQLEILPIHSVYIPRGPPHRQLDLVAIGRLGTKETYYLIENKYTMAPISPSYIERFAERVKMFVTEEKIKNYVAIMIQGGEGDYHPASIATAIKNKIITVTKTGLLQIVKQLGYPKIA